MSDFTLKQESATGRRKLKVVPKDATRQGVLFTGSDCLAGQRDLFDESDRQQPESDSAGDRTGT